MARLPYVDPSSADPEAAALLAQLAGQRGEPLNVYRMLAHSPPVLERIHGLAAYLWRDGALEPALVELVILRVAQLTDSDYEWARHRELARRAGVPDAQVDALRDWRLKPDRFDSLQRAALTLIEEATVDVEASTEAVAAVRELAGEPGTIELLVLAGLYGTVARVLRSLAVDAEPGDLPMPAGDDGAQARRRRV